jgi:hypothetical protein
MVFVVAPVFHTLLIKLLEVSMALCPLHKLFALAVILGVGGKGFTVTLNNDEFAAQLPLPAAIE